MNRSRGYPFSTGYRKSPGFMEIPPSRGRSGGRGAQNSNLQQTKLGAYYPCRKNATSPDSPISYNQSEINSPHNQKYATPTPLRKFGNRIDESLYDNVQPINKRGNFSGNPVQRPMRQQQQPLRSNFSNDGPQAYEMNPNSLYRNPSNFASSDSNGRYGYSNSLTRQEIFDEFAPFESDDENVWPSENEMTVVNQPSTSTSTVTKPQKSDHLQSLFAKHRCYDVEELKQHMCMRHFPRVLTVTTCKLLCMSGHLKDIPGEMIFELFGILGSVSNRNVSGEKRFLLKDQKKGMIECIFFEIDRKEELGKIGEWKRCTGMLTQNGQFQCFSVRSATNDDLRLMDTMLCASGKYLARILRYYGSSLHFP